MWPTRGPLALPGHRDAPELEILREQVIEATSRVLDSTMGRIFGKKTGTVLGRCEVRTKAGLHVFDDLRWSPDIDTMTRLERDAQPSHRHKRLSRSLETALRLADYPVRDLRSGPA
ncbi:MAG: hypothetical protein WD397_08220 [Wenzhouxiangellaceae bacterium]